METLNPKPKSLNTSEVAAAGRALACAEGLRTDGCQFFSSATGTSHVNSLKVRFRVLGFRSLGA